MNKLYTYISLLVLLFSCSKDTMKIGLLSGFTGFDGEMGKDALNGILIPIDRANALGGIKGKKIELIVYDDKGTPEGARSGAEKLIKSGVEVIIGPFLSAQANAALEICEAEKILLFSPTVASSDFKKKDDMLFQLNATADITGAKYAERLVNVHNLKRASIVIDSGNLKFSGAWRDGFVSRFNELGGVLSLDISFNGYSNPALNIISLEIISSEPDAVVIVANAFYTASLAQQLRKKNPDIFLMTSEWAPITMNEVLSLGGSSVEGMEMFNLIDLDSMEPDFLSFKDEYLDRFGVAPGHGGLLAYESAEIIIDSFMRKKKDESLKQAIIDGSPYEGLLFEIEFDKYGNTLMPVVFSVIRNGKYIVVP